MVRTGETFTVAVEITGSTPKSVVIGASPIGFQGERNAPIHSPLANSTTCSAREKGRREKNYVRFHLLIGTDRPK